MMETGDEFVTDMIYEDVRQVLSRRTPARKPDFFPPPVVHALVVMAALLRRLMLGRPAISALVISGLLVVAIVSTFGTNGKTIGRDLPETGRSGPASIAVVPAEVKEKEANAPAVPEFGSVYMLRVATFRNPSNAERLAASLRERSASVRIEILAGGLHAVTLGPFNQKSTATETAREVQELRGIAPQILRRDKSE